MRNLYLILTFLVVALMTGTAAHSVYWVPNVLSCRTNSDPSTFLAYCDAFGFGDYEHGAYVFNFEPNAVTSLRTAEILFLGDSHVQFAFSANATRHYFQEKSVPYYLAGFTYRENVQFARRLIDEYKLRPKAVIVNTDYPFFNDQLNPIPTPLFASKTDPSYWLAFYNYRLKASISRALRPLCDRMSFLCDQKIEAIWRKSDTGDWDTETTFARQNFHSYPIRPWMRRPALDDAALHKIDEVAKNFIGSLNLPPQCIILTATPNSVYDDATIADRLGKLFQLPVVIPQLENLSMIDNEHLDKSSAERWSAAFLHDAGPLIDRCLAR
jgi:hypothetical protein